MFIPRFELFKNKKEEKKEKTTKEKKLVVTVVKDKKGGATIEYQPEQQIQGTVDDYSLGNLLELGVKLEHVTMLNKMSRENLTKYIEDFSKGHIEQLTQTNKKTEE